VRGWGGVVLGRRGSPGGFSRWRLNKGEKQKNDLKKKRREKQGYRKKCVLRKKHKNPLCFYLAGKAKKRTGSLAKQEGGIETEGNYF